jgi:hypothetical protein
MSTDEDLSYIPSLVCRTRTPNVTQGCAANGASTSEAAAAPSVTSVNGDATASFAAFARAASDASFLSHLNDNEEGEAFDVTVGEVMESDPRDDFERAADVLMSSVDPTDPSSAVGDGSLGAATPVLNATHHTGGFVKEWQDLNLGLCFPWLFPYGTGYCQTRGSAANAGGNGVPDMCTIKHFMWHSDPRWRRDLQFMALMYSVHMRKRIAGVSLAAGKRQGAIDIKEVLKALRSQSTARGALLSLLKRASPYSAPLVGSQSYWVHVKGLSNSMYSLPDSAGVFRMLSSADESWPHICILLGIPDRVSRRFTKAEMRNACHRSPAESAIGFAARHRVWRVIDRMFSEETYGALIVDELWRWEFQGRGALHSHEIIHFYRPELRWLVDQDQVNDEDPLMKEMVINAYICEKGVCKITAVVPCCLPQDSTDNAAATTVDRILSACASEEDLRRAYGCLCSPPDCIITAASDPASDSDRQ